LDQLSVRRVLAGLYLLEAAAFLLLGWFADHFTLVPVLALTVIDGVLALAARPLARAASVAVTGPVGLLREGNALTNTSFSICYMAGPALGAGVVLAGGTAAALLVNGGLFAVIALTIATARALPSGSAQPEPAAGRLRAALAHARERPGIRTLLALQVAAVLVFTIAVPVEVVFAQHSLHRGAGGYGALLTAWGGGAVIGSAVYARWRGISSRILIMLGAAALGVGMLVMALAPTLVVAVVGSAVAGVGNGIEAVAVRTALQEQVEAHWMALIMSLNESIFQAVPGGGILLGGAIAALAGARIALGVAGAGALLVAGAAWIVLRAEPVRPAEGLADAWSRTDGPLEPQGRPADASVAAQRDALRSRPRPASAARR
jgi:predicted MFS family arabinose efflux permease